MTRASAPGEGLSWIPDRGKENEFDLMSGRERCEGDIVQGQFLFAVMPGVELGRGFPNAARFHPVEFNGSEKCFLYLRITYSWSRKEPEAIRTVSLCLGEAGLECSE